MPTTREQALRARGAGFGYCGAVTIKALAVKAAFIRIAGAGLTQNHPRRYAQ
jgi:IMP dehydrogenase/GMP reductase